MNATRARTGDRLRDPVVSIGRVNLLGVQVTARALLNCAEHERSSVLGLGAVTDPALLDMLLGLPTGYPCRDPALWAETSVAATGLVDRSLGKDASMDLLAFAKNIAERAEAAASRAKAPVAVCVIDIHGNVVLQHRMKGAPVFSIELSERKAYTSALVRMRTADLLPLVQPGRALFPLMTVSEGRYCAMGGGAPLTNAGEVVAGVGVSGGTSSRMSPSSRRRWKRTGAERVDCVL